MVFMARRRVRTASSTSFLDGSCGGGGFCGTKLSSGSVFPVVGYLTLPPSSSDETAWWEGENRAKSTTPEATAAAADDAVLLYLPSPTGTAASSIGSTAFDSVLVAATIFCASSF